MHCLLLGNGINRLSLQLQWSTLLERLARELGVEGSASPSDDKPLSLYFEELCARTEGKIQNTERSIKRKIAGLLLDVQPDPIHEAIGAQFGVILTTNYDHTLEHALGSPLFEHSSVRRESRYSLFRRIRVGTKQVWHIHGDITTADSILLGYDHYAGYLQKIRNYLTSGLEPGNKLDPVRSPLKSGVHDFEEWERRSYSWVDYFLRDHLHIVGLSLDFTEIDIWWLLLHKRRRYNQTGYTFYYNIRIDGVENARDAPRLSVLRSLGMNVVSVNAANYREGYERVVNEVSRNLEQHPVHREANVSAGKEFALEQPVERSGEVRRAASKERGFALGGEAKRGPRRVV
jgi:hypothetical protein